MHFERDLTEATNQSFGQCHIGTEDL